MSFSVLPPWADADVPANAQLRTLIHECAHAPGIDYERYSRAQAEVIVDTVTYLAAASVGLAVDGETIPYVAGWGEDGALEGVYREFVRKTGIRTPRRRRSALPDCVETSTLARLSLPSVAVA